MRLGLCVFACVYCVWRTESTGMPKASSVRVPRQEELEEGVSEPRYKRSLYPPPLVSPYGGNLKLLMGIAVPISISGGRILGFGQNFQFQYPIPPNATFFTNYYDSDGSTGRMARSTTNRHRNSPNVIKKMDDTRSMFYQSLEMSYERWGGNGKSCLLRSICDAAETPLEDEGLVGELLHVMLTPDYGYGLNGRGDDDDDDDYLRAAKAGRSGQSCSFIYRDCPEGAGLLDRISLLDYV